MQKIFTQFDRLYSQSTNLKQLKTKFAVLDELNIILRSILEETLISLCHVGAVDFENNTIIIFVKNSQVLYKLKMLSNHILQKMEKNGFSFNKLLIKVSQSKAPQPQRIKYKKLDDKYKQKLTDMAHSLGKPELIHNESNSLEEEKEIEF